MTCHWCKPTPISTVPQGDEYTCGTLCIYGVWIKSEECKQVAA